VSTHLGLPVWFPKFSSKVRWEDRWYKIRKVLLVMRGGSPRPYFQLGFQLLSLISKKIYLALLVFKILTTDSNVVLLQQLEDEYEQDWHLTIYYILRLSPVLIPLVSNVKVYGINLSPSILCLLGTRISKAREERV